MVEPQHDVYCALRERLDQIGFGYSATESGVEYTFLKRFFTPEQAQWFVELPFDRYVDAACAATIFGVDEDEAERRLRELSDEGLIFREHEGEGFRYHVMPFAHGIFEFHVDRVEDEWSFAMGKHYMSGWGRNFYGASDTPIFRTVPMSADVVEGATLPIEDDIEAMVFSHERAAVADCMCRLRNEGFGHSCKHEMEACLSFDAFADFYIENGLAHEISLDEAFDIIKKCTKSGCVLSVANERVPDVVCCCCQDACGLLGAIKYFPGPAVRNVGNYVCVRDVDSCIEPRCQHNCAKVCPVGAFKSKEGVLDFKAEQCIGCGLCVNKCPGRALILRRKANEEVYFANDSLFDTYTEISRQRGVLA